MNTYSVTNNLVLPYIHYILYSCLFSICESLTVPIFFSLGATILSKKVSDFPSPAGNNPGIIKLLPARESLVNDIPAGDGKIANLFYNAMTLYTTQDHLHSPLAPHIFSAEDNSCLVC